MEAVKEFLISPLGSIFNYFLRALIGSICVCGGIQLFNFSNYSRFFTLRKIIGLFLLAIGANDLIRVLFR
jgi:hypothetical protein